MSKDNAISVLYIIVFMWDKGDEAIGMDTWADAMQVILSFVVYSIGVHCVHATTSIHAHH